MQRHWRSIGFDVRPVGHLARVMVLLLAACLWLAASAQAQTANTQPQNAPTAPDAPVSGTRPGFLDAIGRLFGQSKEAIDSQFRSTQDSLGELGNKATSAAKDAASAAGQAAGSVAALPGTRVVTGKQLCPVAANGAPDCQLGAAVLCRDKGFPNGGRSLDIATSQRCPIRSWLSSKGPQEGDCRIENHVTRAVCQ